MSDEINVLYNELREIAKLPVGEERHDRIKAVLNKMASIGVSVVASSADPSLSVAVYFGGFSVMGLVLAAIEADKDNAMNVLNLMQTVFGMCTQTVMDADKKKDKESN